jgi:hypothetical protein
MDPETGEHLKYLVGLSLLSKLVIAIFTVFIVGAGMDMYAISYYLENALTLFQGHHMLYIDYYYEYPILLFVPVLLAMIPYFILNSVAVFMLSFSILMILCDTITVMCVYLIARKVWSESKTAFIAACIYMTALAVQYFAMTDCSSFAVMIMMGAITILLYGKEITGISWLTDYMALILGYFAKFFPLLILPFVIFYKSKTTSLKYEITSVLKTMIPVSILLILPIFIFNPWATIKTYIPIRLDAGWFPNTIIYTLQVWLHDIFNLPVTLDHTFMFVYACMIICLSALLYSAFKYKKQDSTMLLKFILCTLTIIVLSYKARSPGYIMWFLPIACILIADNVYKIGWFYITQILTYLVFPVAFWSLWTNAEWTNPMYSTNWYLALILFSAESLSLLILMWIATEPIKMYKEIFKTEQANIISCDVS